jgi:heptosyltransferase-2
MDKILIEVPSWLGDCVMTTPAIENIVKKYPDVKITLFGSSISTAIFEEHPNVEDIVIDESRKSSSRIIWYYKKAKTVGKFDASLTFRRTFSSKLFLFFTKAKIKGYYKRYTKDVIHQAVRYNDFISKVFNFKLPAGDLKIYIDPCKYEKPTLGINPGASYGSAKRWYPEKFSEVASVLSTQYNIVIFGGPGEVDIAKDIESELKKSHITNYVNLAGKTTIKELCEKIGGLDLFITGDSGPMHIAAAFKVPTVSIFGPTKDKETSQWHNLNAIIVKRNMTCAPCMKRTCPLGHHECMKLIEPTDVLNAVKELKC